MYLLLRRSRDGASELRPAKAVSFSLLGIALFLLFALDTEARMRKSGEPRRSYLRIALETLAVGLVLNAAQRLINALIRF